MVRNMLAALALYLRSQLTRKRIRIFLAAIILVSSAQLGIAYVSGESTSESLLQREADKPFDERKQIAPPRENLTVVTGYNGPLIALDPTGRINYYNNSYRSYWDVDPISEGSHTLVYTANDHLNSSVCPATVRCTLNVIERINITTGATEVLYSEYAPGYGPQQWHDADRLNETHIVVADIVEDEVFIVDTSTGMKTWVWEAQNSFSIGSGGSEAFASSWPDDWTHVNDVEVLDDGRIMVSLRNQDQIVFLNRQTGLIESWTLGAENQYSILAEQHNPDYIPPPNGGPAVLVADSHNDRVIEYQRNGGKWKRSWNYSNEEMHWPRDADRLPNGHTLITISNSQRLIEIDEGGNIVWSVSLAYNIYEAERLGTGPESSGGPSAEVADLANQGEAEAKYSGKFTRGTSARIINTVKTLLPKRVFDGILFILPSWIDAEHIIWLIGIAGSISIWLTFELIWSPYVRSPIGRPQH